MFGLPTVKLSAKSVTSIEQSSTGTRRGLRTMASNNTNKFINHFILFKK